MYNQAVYVEQYPTVSHEPVIVYRSAPSMPVYQQPYSRSIPLQTQYVPQNTIQPTFQSFQQAPTPVYIRESPPPTVQYIRHPCLGTAVPVATQPTVISRSPATSPVIIRAPRPQQTGHLVHHQDNMSLIASNHCAPQQSHIVVQEPASCCDLASIASTVTTPIYYTPQMARSFCCCPCSRNPQPPCAHDLSPSKRVRGRRTSNHETNESAAIANLRLNVHFVPKEQESVEISNSFTPRSAGSHRHSPRYRDVRTSPVYRSAKTRNPRNTNQQPSSREKFSSQSFNSNYKKWCPSKVSKRRESSSEEVLHKVVDKNPEPEEKFKLESPSSSVSLEHHLSEDEEVSSTRGHLESILEEELASSHSYANVLTISDNRGTSKSGNRTDLTISSYPGRPKLDAAKNDLKSETNESKNEESQQSTPSASIAYDIPTLQTAKITRAYGKSVRSTSCCSSVHERELEVCGESKCCKCQKQFYSCTCEPIPVVLPPKEEDTFEISWVHVGRPNSSELDSSTVPSPKILIAKTSSGSDTKSESYWSDSVGDENKRVPPILRTTMTVPESPKRSRKSFSTSLSREMIVGDWEQSGIAKISSLKRLCSEPSNRLSRRSDGAYSHGVSLNDNVVVFAYSDITESSSELVEDQDVDEDHLTSMPRRKSFVISQTSEGRKSFIGCASHGSFQITPINDEDSQLSLISDEYLDEPIPEMTIIARATDDQMSEISSASIQSMNSIAEKLANEMTQDVHDNRE